MSSLRPASVCDTTPLQRLESQSSSSEPSSPISNDAYVGNVGTASPVGVAASMKTASTTTTLTLSNHNINNNKLEMRLSNFVNGAGNTQKMDAYGARDIFKRIFLDLLILACVGLPIFGFHLWGESYKRGFFCDDESLKHPYRDSTVHSWMLYLMGFVVPMAIITIVEFFKSNTNRMRGFENLSENYYYLWQLQIPDWMVECYKKIGGLVFGAGVCQLTTEIAKYSIGRLRPHFFAVCQPVMYDGSTCDSPINAGRYIENFTCSGGLNATPRMLKEVSLSFPSGHANFSFYTMIYIAIYLQTRVTARRSKMFKHLLQFLFLMFAWYTALTRVSDYKHHWTDVLAGSAIGTFYALVVTSSLW